MTPFNLYLILAVLNFIATIWNYHNKRNKSAILNAVACTFILTVLTTTTL